jgi:hypothetical protein
MLHKNGFLGIPISTCKAGSLGGMVGKNKLHIRKQITNKTELLRNIIKHIHIVAKNKPIT